MTNVASNPNFPESASVPSTSKTMPLTLLYSGFDVVAKNSAVKDDDADNNNDDDDDGFMMMLGNDQVPRNVVASNRQIKSL